MPAIRVGSNWRFVEGRTKQAQLVFAITKNLQNIITHVQLKRIVFQSGQAMAINWNNNETRNIVQINVEHFVPFVNQWERSRG